MTLEDDNESSEPPPYKRVRMLEADLQTTQFKLEQTEQADRGRSGKIVALQAENNALQAENNALEAQKGALRMSNRAFKQKNIHLRVKLGQSQRLEESLREQFTLKAEEVVAAEAKAELLQNTLDDVFRQFKAACDANTAAKAAKAAAAAKTAAAAEAP